MKVRLLSLVFLFFFGACSKKDHPSNNNLADTPTAKAQYDNSNYGIYKGVFVGSSGIIIININNDNTIAAMLKIDGTTYNFTATQTIQQSQETTVNFVAGSNTFTFSVSPNGASPVVTHLVINGHPNAAILVVKETSTALVRCYEGTFSGSDTGIFNAIIYNNSVKALVKNSDNVTEIANGTVSNNQINAGTITSGATFMGTIEGDNTSGTWANTAANLKGSWSGRRTY